MSLVCPFHGSTFAECAGYSRFRSKGVLSRRRLTSLELAKPNVYLHSTPFNNRSSPITRALFEYGSPASETLERAIQTVNKAIFDYDERRQLAKNKNQQLNPRESDVASRAQNPNDLEHLLSAPLKNIKLHAIAKASRPVREPNKKSLDGKDTGLLAYLALPVEEYSLLDPAWIERHPETPSVFTLLVPLYDAVGVDLQPQLDVEVCADPASGKVRFIARALRLGNPALDKALKVQMQTELRGRSAAGAGAFAKGGKQVMSRIFAAAKGVGRRSKVGKVNLPARSASSSSSSAYERIPLALAAEDETTPPAGLVAGQPGESNPSGVEDPPTVYLEGRVDLAVMVGVPPPLSAAPSAVLGWLGSLVLRLALKALLPSFLDLLESDYLRWAKGSSLQERAAPSGQLVRGHRAAATTAGGADVSELEAVAAEEMAAGVQPHGNGQRHGATVAPATTESLEHGEPRRAEAVAAETELRIAAGVHVPSPAGAVDVPISAEVLPTGTELV